MAERAVADDVTSLMDIVKGSISKLTVEILTKPGLNARDHNPIVFCNKASEHGDLFIRKEFLMNVLKDCNSVDQRLKVL